MSEQLSVTVAAVIRRGDRYLVVEEAPDGSPVINQPAGHLEAGETLLEAVCREVLEETGLRFAPTGLVGVYQWTVPANGQRYLRFCFCGDVDDCRPALARDPDIIANHWLGREQIIAGALPPRSPLVLRCIDDAARRRPASLDLIDALS